MCDGGSRYGQGLYVADRFEHALDYAFEVESPATYNQRSALRRMSADNIFVSNGRLRTDQELQRNQNIRTWRQHFESPNGGIREDSRIQRGAQLRQIRTNATWGAQCHSRTGWSNHL